MKTYRTHAVAAGALYILGTVAGVLSVVVVGGFPDETFITRLAADPSQVTIAAFLTFVMGMALASMTLFLYPLFRKDSEVLALGMVLFRGAFEGTWYILSALAWLALGALGAAIAAAEADAAALQTVGDIVLQVSGKLDGLGSIIFIIGALCLYASFYRTRLIPRWLSGWGLLAAIPYGMFYLLQYFGIELAEGLLVAPLAVQEMVMGLWLIIKGFDLDAVKALDGTDSEHAKAGA